MITTALTLITAFADPPGYAPQPEIADVELVQSTESTHVLAYDPDGEVTAEVVIWRLDGQTRLDATWPDGLYLSVVTNGETSTIETEDSTEVMERLELLNSALPEPTGWGKCAGAVVLAAFPCGALRPIVCAGAAYYAACDCIEAASDGENSCWDE